MPRANRTSLFWGAVLILLGVVFLLNNFHLMPANLVQWWPALVIGGGVWLLARGLVARRGAGLIAGTVLAILGGFWLLDSLGRMDERLFVPVLLIALGAGLLMRNLLYVAS